MATAAAREDDALDAKSLMRCVASAADESEATNCVEDTDDASDLDSGPHSSMLHVSIAGARPPSTRSSNYRVPLTTSASALSSAPHLSPLATSPTRRLPEITLDLAPSAPVSGLSVAPSPGSGSIGVSLPSPSPEAKKKSLLMASLAIGLNEVIPTDDDDDEGGAGGDDSAFAKAHSNSRSPKKFQLGLPQKSAPSPKHSPAHSNASSPTHTSSGSKLLPISFGASHAPLKFDPVLGSKESGDDHAPRGDASSAYRRSLAASRSSLRTTAAAQDLDAFVAPSKLDPLDAEAIRGSTYTPSPASKALVPSERKSTKLPSSISLSSSLPSSESAAAAQQSPSSSKPSAVSPQDKLSPTQPKFRNPFKKTASKRLAADDTGDSDNEEEQSIDLISDATHASASRATAVAAAETAAAPMDELAYLSFSPRQAASTSSSSSMSLGAKALLLRELPSLSLASDAKDASGQALKRVKKPSDKHTGGSPGQTQAK